MQSGGSTGPNSTESIFASPQYIGRIIGKQGAKIKEMQQKPICRIQIEQKEKRGGPYDSVRVSLTGTPPGISMATRLINKVTNENNNQQNKAWSMRF